MAQSGGVAEGWKSYAKSKGITQKTTTTKSTSSSGGGGGGSSSKGVTKEAGGFSLTVTPAAPPAPAPTTQREAVLKIQQERLDAAIKAGDTAAASKLGNAVSRATDSLNNTSSGPVRSLTLTDSQGRAVRTVTAQRVGSTINVTDTKNDFSTQDRAAALYEQQKRELYAARGAPLTTVNLGTLFKTEKAPVMSVSTSVLKAPGFFRQGTAQDTVTLTPGSMAQSVLLSGQYGGSDKSTPYAARFDFKLPERSFKSSTRTAIDNPLTTSALAWRGESLTPKQAGAGLLGVGLTVGKVALMTSPVPAVYNAFSKTKGLLGGLAQGTSRFGLGVARSFSAYTVSQDATNALITLGKPQYGKTVLSSNFQAAVFKTELETGFTDKYLKPSRYNKQLKENLGLYGLPGTWNYKFGIANTRIVKPTSNFIAAVYLETGGEGAGRSFTPAIKSAVTGISNPAKAAAKVATFRFGKKFVIGGSGSAIAGFGEGFAGSVGQDLQLGIKPDYKRASLWGGVGAISAGTLGGLIDVSANATPNIPSRTRAFERVGYLIDYSEKPGDMLTDALAPKAARAVRRVPVLTPSASLSWSYTPSVPVTITGNKGSSINAFTNTRTGSFSITDTRSFSFTQTKAFSFSNTNIFSNVPSSSTTPSTTPSTNPSFTFTPSNVPGFTPSNVPSNTNTNVPSDTFTFTPTFTPPGFGLPAFGFGRGAKSGRSSSGAKSKTFYTPSIAGALLRIKGGRGAKSLGFKTGITIRPL